MVWVVLENSLKRKSGLSEVTNLLRLIDIETQFRRFVDESEAIQSYNLQIISKPR